MNILYIVYIFSAQGYIFYIKEVIPVQNKSNFITKKQVARILGVSSSTVFRWASSGYLPKPFLLGPNRTVWDLDELNKWIDERKKHRGFLSYNSDNKN